MVATPINPQQLFARDDTGERSDWGPIQIAIPAILGCILLFVIAAYIIRQRNPPRELPYDYHNIRSDWVSKTERAFLPGGTRVQALHSGAPVTLDDFVPTPSLMPNFRRARQHRSGSSDSQIPLTSTDHTSDYHQNKKLPGLPLPTPKRRALRWWWFFGSRPREVKPKQPGLRWHIDGPDENNTEHGHGQEARPARYAALETVDAEREEAGDNVIQIGEISMMTQHFAAHTAGGMLTVPGQVSGSTVSSAVPSYVGTPVSSANHGLLPSHDVSQSPARYAWAENVRSSPCYMVTPPPVRIVGYASPRVFHVRALSTESALATQPPIVAPSTY